MPVQRLMIRCPKTGRPFPAGVSMDLESFKGSEMENNRSECPYCGESHVWSKKNVFWEGESHN